MMMLSVLALAAASLRPGAPPEMQRLYAIARHDVESNIVETPQGRFLGAGTTYHTRVFTRDVAYSGILGLNRLYPDLVLSSLKFTRQLMFAAGFHVPDGYVVPEIPAPWAVSSAGLSAQYPIGPVTRRTDDVVWLWCADDLLGRMPHPDWAWMYADGQRCFDDFYRYFFDPSDGLYRAQASFVDIHYPDRKASGYHHDWSVGDCVLAKPLSTNCLYVLGLDAMGDAAARLGRAADAARWHARADALRAAIVRNLRRSDGSFAYLKDRSGQLQPRRDALGTALVVLSRTVRGADAQAAVAGYPVTDRGVPLFDPFFPIPQTYHNNTAWPFVDTFFLWAKEQADGTDETARNAALLARVCADPARGFREYVVWKTGAPSGSGHQLWSSAAFVDVCLRAGLLPGSG